MKTSEIFYHLVDYIFLKAGRYTTFKRQIVIQCKKKKNRFDAFIIVEYEKMSYKL